MKKYLFTIALAALVVLPNSCTKSEVRPSDGQQPTPDTYNGELAMMSFQAVTEAVSSKTSLTIEGETASVSWASGDAVKFIYEIDKAPSYAESSALTASDINGGQATFSASVPADFALSNGDFTGSSRHLYAVYPSTVAHDYSNASTFYVTVPSVQDGSFANASIALAKWQQDSPTAPLVFKNLCGLLQVVVSDADVRKIVLSSDAVIAGKVSVTFPDNATPGVKAVSAGETEITVNVPGAGTYYVAVLPAEITNLYFALYDGSDNLIGDKMSGNTLSVARKQIRKLGTLATGFADRMYFTPDGQGTKDGSSWDNAGDVELLKTTMTSATTKSLYLAKGDYNLANSACTAASNLKLYGGYPENPTGYALSGRDVANNVSKLMNADKNRVFYIQSDDAIWLFDGISFLCTNYNGARGGAFSLLKGTATLNNCTFDGCSNTGGSYGGVIRIDAGTTATFNGCNFLNNTVTNNGGVFYVNGAANLTIDDCTFTDNSAGNLGGAIHFQANTGSNCTITNCTFNGNSTSTVSPGDNTGHGSAISTAGTGGGVITVEKSTFSGNTAANKGAVFVRANHFRFIDCDFLDNATGNSDYHGSSVYIDRAFSAYFEGCYFSYTTASCDGSGVFTGSGINVCVGTGSYASVAGFNNCVFAGSWGSNSMQQLMVDGSSAKATVVNSTFFDQTTGGNLRLKQGTLNVINSIVVNAASSGKGGTYGSVNGTSGMTLNMDYTWYTKTNATATENINNSLGGVQVYIDGNANTNFANGWYKTNSLAMYNDNQTKTVTANGWTTHYYEWSNEPTAAGIESYIKPSLATVGALVNTADSDFYTWLNTNGYLGKDIRGEARNNSAMWPGSYEQASAVASAPAFNLR